MVGLELGLVFQELTVNLQAALDAAVNGVFGATLQLDLLGDLLNAAVQILTALFG